MTLEKPEVDIEQMHSGRTSEVESKTSVALSRVGTEAGNSVEGEADEEADEVEHLLPGTNIVTHCIFKNDPQRLIRCFEDDQDPYKDEVQDLLNQRVEDGKSPLDIAASLGRNTLTQELLKRGADVHNITKKGYSCMHYAAVWGRLPVIKMFFEAGADLQQRNIHGERPREAAVRYGQNECIDYLDWAEAKTLLQEAIKQTMETVTDTDKTVAGRLTKEEKTITMNQCKEKQEWLDNIEDATTQDFIAKRIEFNEVVTPLLQKLTEPPPDKGSARPSSRSRSRPKSSSRPESKVDARPKSGKSSAKKGAGGPMFNPQKGKKKGK